MNKKTLVENLQKQASMQKMSHVAKKKLIHTAWLIYQEEQNAAEKEFSQHNKKAGDPT